MTVLNEIVESVRMRVENESKLRSVDDMELGGSLKRSLRESIKTAPRNPVITEMKRASPSSGNIRPDLDVSEAARAMDRGGSVGISVLTEPEYFGGKLEFIPLVRNTTLLPVLRKDFIVDKYQLYESAEVGADAVLLIAEVLSKSLPEFVEIARELRIESLIEVSNEEQIDFAVMAEPDLIGINNRDLKTMEIDLARTQQLAGRIPNHMTTVSESGISDASDVGAMLNAGADAVLVGTSIMNSGDIEAKVRELVTSGG